MTYVPMTCRECGVVIQPDLEVLRRLGTPPTATSHAQCVYRCLCGAGYSNSRDEAARRLIWERPELNVPKEVRDGLDDVLSRAVNEFNRPKKGDKFSSERSEDAVTWTVLRYLERHERLGAIADPEHPTGAPSLLLWGAPVDGPRSDKFATLLRGVCIALGEASDRLSEPDVALIWDDLTVLVEAKHLSGNVPQRDYKNFDRYFDRPELFCVPTHKVKSMGFYELVRNWRIGTEVAERLDTDFRFVNLGPPAIEASAAAFAQTVAQTERRNFTHLTWADLLGRISPNEPWFEEYSRHRGLV